MRKLLTAALVVGIVGFAASSGLAQWTENFDTYTAGNISGNGPWVDFGGSLTSDVSASQANSAPHSLALSLNPAGGTAYGSDVYATTLDPGGVLTSGQWYLRYQLYVESGYNGATPMYISEAAMDGTAAGFVDGLTLGRDAANGRLDVEINFTSVHPGPALVYDSWTEVELLIDLLADTVLVSYGGTPFYSAAWDADATGTPSLGGINFWADGPAGASGTYYVDDFSLVAVPEPAAAVLLGLGGLVVALLRRKS